MSDREIQTDDIDRIREGIQAELDRSWEFDSLQRLDRLTADAANVAEESPDEIAPLAEPLTKLLSRTVDEEYSMAGEMIGKENLLRSVKQQTASSLARFASESPQRVAPILTELTRVAIREDDEDVRDELETVFDSVAGEDHHAVCEAVSVLKNALNGEDLDYQSRTVETVGWIGYRNSAAVADLVDTLRSLVDGQNVKLTKRVLNTLGKIIKDPSYIEETVTPEDAIAFGSTAGTYLSAESIELRVSAASFLNSVSQKDPSVIRDFLPELVDLSIESKQAHSDASESLSSLVIDCPEVIAEITPRLRVGLSSGDSDMRKRIANLVSEITRKPYSSEINAKVVGAVVDFVPELINMLIESEGGVSAASRSLQNIGARYPEAIADVKPRLRAGLTSDDPIVQRQTANIISETIHGGFSFERNPNPNVAVDLVAELTDLLFNPGLAGHYAARALEPIGYEYPEEIIEVIPRLRAGLTSDDPDLQERTVGILKETASGDPDAVVDFVPKLTDLLVESEQVRSDAGGALERIGSESPEAITEVTSRLRAGLTSDDPDLQERTVRILKETASGDPDVVVDFVPELTDLLVESERVRSDAGGALERIGSESPEAIAEVMPRLRAGLISDDLDIQAWTIELMKKPIGTDTGVVIDLVPELIDLLIKLQDRSDLRTSPGPVDYINFDGKQARPDADGILKRIGSEYPEAIAKITSRLRMGLTSHDPDTQVRTAKIIKETASCDPSAVADLIPELTDLLIESEQAKCDAREALTHVVTYRPKSVKTVLSERVDDLRSCDTDIQTQVTKLIRFGAETHPNVFLDFSPELTTLLGDETYEIRKNAALTLIYISEGNPTDLAEHRSQFRELIMHEETTHEIKIVLVGVLCQLGSKTIIDPMMD
jgi:hypothetical protein